MVILKQLLVYHLFVIFNRDSILVLYENIDQILSNKLHGPMHYKIDVTCEYNGHMFYTLL